MPSAPTSRIEIFAPDRDATDLLLLYAAPLFPAEIAAGAVWIVRLQVPGGPGPMLELLSLVQCWLEAARLPWANLRYYGRSHLIRPSTAFAQFAAAMEFMNDSALHQVTASPSWTRPGLTTAP